MFFKIDGLSEEDILSLDTPQNISLIYSETDLTKNIPAQIFLLRKINQIDLKEELRLLESTGKFKDVSIQEVEQFFLTKNIGIKQSNSVKNIAHVFSQS